jgi:hypothetical protein
MLWRREKSLASAENQTIAVQQYTVFFNVNVVNRPAFNYHCVLNG